MKDKKCDINLYFIGIGGVSMSALAKYLFGMGFNVSGSDIKGGEVVGELMEKGIKVYIGGNVEEVKRSEVVVYNSAIKDDDEELVVARESGAYLIARAELLKQVGENFKKRIGVCGCHGKTTVTCMLTHIYDEAKAKYTAHIGGFDGVFGNFRRTGDEVFISEVCEFKKNIDLFSPDVGVCLSTEPDHLDCYSGEEELLKSYYSFIKRGYKSIISTEDKNLRTYDGGNKVTFGKCEGDFHAANASEKNGRYCFDLIYREKKLGRIELKVVGEYNMFNAIAAAACAYTEGIKFSAIKRGLENFTGVKRRFEKIGSLSGAAVIADYAHHPSEIRAALKTAEKIAKDRLYVVFQPHTYSRTLFLKDDFKAVLGDVERLILFKTFPARERPIEGGSAYDLYEEMGKRGQYFDDADKLYEFLKSNMREKDAALILGAGDLYDIMKKKLN